MAVRRSFFLLLVLLLASVLFECALGSKLDFLSARNDEAAVELGGDIEEDVGDARQLLNVVTIASFNSTLLQLGIILVSLGMAI